MRRLAVAMTITAVLAGTAACGGDDSKPPSAADCARTDLSPERWLECAVAGGASTTATASATATRYTAPVGGQRLRMPDGLELSLEIAAIPVVPDQDVPPPGVLTQRLTRPGETAVIATLTIANTGDAPRDVSGIFFRGMTGTVGGGEARDVAYLNVETRDPAGTVAPGRSTTATRTYLVPDGVAQGYEVAISMQTGFGETQPDAVFTGAGPFPAGPAPAPTGTGTETSTETGTGG